MLKVNSVHTILEFKIFDSTVAKRISGGTLFRSRQC